MSKLDKLRKAQGRVTGKEPEQMPKAEPSYHAEPEAKVPEVKPEQRVLYLCGHTNNNQACGACRGEQRKKKHEARLAKRLAEKPKRLEDRGRLPHGSYFSDLKWDGERGLWTGSIHIMENGVQVYWMWGTGTALFHLLACLDGEYRKWLAGWSRAGEGQEVKTTVES